MVMTGGVSHELVQEWYEAWNRRDWDVIEGFLADDFEGEDVALQRRFSGKREYLDYAREWARAFENGAVYVSRISGSGHEGLPVLVEYVGRGTQTGTFAGFPSRGQRAEFKCCDILRFRNGKLVHCRTYMDLFGPLGDLGHLATGREAA